MTALTNHREPPAILPPKHAQPSLRQRAGAALAAARRWLIERSRPWSFGIVALGFLMLLVPVGEEVAEVAGYELPPVAHLVLAGVAFGGVAIYLLHKGTSDLK